MLHAPKIGERRPGRALAGAAIIVSLFSFGPAARAKAADDVTVTATVDRTEMDPNDTLYLTVNAVSGSESKARIPGGRELQKGPLRSFNVLKEWEESSARSQMGMDANGHMSFQTIHQTSRHFGLQPRGAGTLKVESIDVAVGDKVVQTQPISVRVAPGAGARGRERTRGGNGAPPPPSPAQPGEEEDDEDLFALLLRRQGLPVPPGFGGGGSRAQPLNPPLNPQEAFFVQVDVDKAAAYAGEQVTASWYLYTRGQIRDLDTLKYPNLRGFWKEDIEIATHLNFTQEVVNGIPYKKALLASFALFPIKEGIATIDSYTAKCSVIAFDDPFGALSGKSYAFTKSSGEVKIPVKAVPVEGRPADYSGAVGDFGVTARVEDPKILANQPFSFKIRFEGRGNAKLIEMPPFDVPEGMELYDTQKEAKFFRTGTSFKDFTLLLIPRHEGQFTLPSVSASIFDPAQKKFVTRRTEPVVVVALPGAASGVAPALPLAGSESGKKDGLGKDGSPAPDPEFRAGSRLATEASAPAIGSLLIAALLALLWRARRLRLWGQARRRLPALIKARFRRIETRAAAGDWRAVGREAINAFYWALGEASGEGGASVQIEKLLMRAPPSVRRELGDEASRTLEKLQALAFAPEAAVGGLKEKASLAELLKSTEALLLRAAALAESFERSNEFEPGPRAS